MYCSDVRSSKCLPFKHRLPRVKNELCLDFAFLFIIKVILKWGGSAAVDIIFLLAVPFLIHLGLLFALSFPCTS